MNWSIMRERNLCKSGKRKNKRVLNLVEVASRLQRSVDESGGGSGSDDFRRNVVEVDGIAPQTGN